MPRRALIILLAVFLPAVPLSARIITVPGECPTIQAGLHKACGGDTVLVAEGIYYENIRFYGKGILLTSYLGEERDRRSAAETVIDGSYPVNPDSSAVVYFVDDEDSTSVIRGFTLTHEAPARGRGVRLTGPGVRCDRASPTIVGNLIVGNSRSGISYGGEGGRRLKVIGNEIRWNAASTFGGGINIEASFGYAGSSALIEDNVISGNTACYGGALSVRFGQSNRVVLRRNTICGNAACAGCAAGIWCEKGHTRLVLEKNLIIGNSGGALTVADYDPGSEVVVVNNTVCGNTEGLRLWFALRAEIKNNIISGNGTGVRVDYVLGYSILYNDVWDNEGGDYVGCEPGVGDISADPLFVGGIPPDYHLTALSPCIDAGDPRSPPDPDGTRADMGALYFDQATGVDEGVSTRGALAVWPNPFSGAARFSLELPTSRDRLKLAIYDMRGRVVRCLDVGATGFGPVEFVWDGRTESGVDAPSGVYFCRCLSDGRACAKVVKLR